MKRKIITTINISRQIISISVFQVMENDKLIELFFANDQVDNFHVFLKTSLEKISKELGATIDKVSIILDSPKLSKPETKIIEHKIDLVSEIVKKEDINLLLDEIKQKFQEKSRKLADIWVINYVVKKNLEKKYFAPPLGKSGYQLGAKVLLSFISEDIFLKLKKFLSNYNLKIHKIMSMPQSLSHARLSDLLMLKGAQLIHFHDNYAFLTLNKHLTTIKTFTFKKLAFNDLVNKIAETFDISTTQAKELLWIRVNLDDKPKKKNGEILITKISGEEVLIKEKDLNTIVKGFLSAVFQHFQKIILKEKINIKPLVISGWILNFTNILTFTKNFFTNKVVYQHQKISFLEKCENLDSALGLAYSLVRQKEYQSKETTIIDTNPDLVMQYLQKGKKTSKFKKPMFINNFFRSNKKARNM